MQGVSIITCTIRPRFMDNVFENYARQDWDEKELIIILNKDELDLQKWKEKAEKYNNVAVYQLPEIKTLGECLNYGVDQSRHGYIAKFDDDDYYSPYYIPQAMKAFIEEQADIVGKKTIYNYFKKNQKLGLRSSIMPVGGGTIMFNKEIFKKVRFPPTNNGEDAKFLRRAKRHHFKIYSTNPYNYVSIRANPLEHTWKISNKRLLSRSQDVITTDNFVPLVTQVPCNLKEKKHKKNRNCINNERKQ